MKNNIIVLMIILIIMFILPFFAVMIAPSDAGMAICFILFLVINPIFSVVIGIYCGLQLKIRWFMLIVSSAAYLISCWLIFDADEPAFVIYSLVYLIISFIVSLITALIKKIKHNF